MLRVLAIRGRFPSGVQEMGGYQIKPGLGAGSFYLGETREGVSARCGDPQMRSTSDFEDGTSEERWSYDDEGIELVFYSGDDWRLGTINVREETSPLCEVFLLGLEEDDFLSRFEQTGLGDLECDEEHGELELCYYSCDSAGLMFAVSDGIMDELTVTAIHDDDGPMWPDLSKV